MVSIPSSRDIYHKKQKRVKRTNVDALSRPTLLVDMLALTRAKSENQIEVKDAVEKTLDPWENEPYLMRDGSEIAGISKNQAKRVEKLAKKYEYDGEKLNITIREHKREIPDQFLRPTLVKAAHDFGHFQVQATFNSLKEEFFWPKMYHDVEKIVKGCRACQRNEPHKVYNNPAIALPITGLL